MLRTIFFAACVAVMTTTNAIQLEDGDRTKALKVLGTTEEGVKNAKANKILGVT